MAGSFINLKMLNDALDDVRDELGELDLLTDRLDEVEVILTPFHPWTDYGYYVEESPWLSRWLGWEGGNIYIPSLRLTSLSGLFGNSEYFSLRNVLRHEYGHAVAHLHPGLIKRSREFTHVFGGRYDTKGPVEGYSPLQHVSTYAATKPQEDFAETFAYFVKSKGDVARYFHRPGVFMKMCFVGKLSEKLARAA